MTTASLLVAVSAGTLLSFGTLHLLFTFCGPKFLPRDPTLKARMEAVSPVISGETTMWKAWIGFNASHSLGAMLFGLVYGYLALTQPALLFGSAFLLLVGFALLSSFLWLGWRYWFSVPFRGIALAWICYVLALVI
jgi:hypothetical protein